MLVVSLPPSVGAILSTTEQHVDVDEDKLDRELEKIVRLVELKKFNKAYTCCKELQASSSSKFQKTIEEYIQKINALEEFQIVAGFVRVKDYDSAHGRCDELLRSWPRELRHSVHSLRAYVQSMAGDKKGAIAGLSEALRQSPGNVQYLSSRMSLFAETRNHKAAIADASSIIDEEKNHRAFRNDALLTRALMYARVGRIERAKADLGELEEGTETRLDGELWTASRVREILELNSR